MSKMIYTRLATLRAKDATEDSENRLGVVTEDQKGYYLIHWVTPIERSTKSNNKQIHQSDTLTI
jgi:hypothetical protein